MSDERSTPARARPWVLLLIGTATAMATAATTAWGADSERSFLDTEANTGFYAAVSGGQSDEKLDTGAFAHAPPLFVNGGGLGLQLAAGYRPLPAWSGEIDYVRLGRASAGGSHANVDGVMISALGYLPTPVLNLYGRIGALRARTFGVYGGPLAPGPVPLHHKNTNLAFGIGLITNFKGNLNFRLETQGFQVTHSRASSLFSIGFVWSFR